MATTAEMLICMVKTLQTDWLKLSGPTTHYTSQSSQPSYFGLVLKLKELTWMTRNKSGRCGRYGTYKGHNQEFQA